MNTATTAKKKRKAKKARNSKKRAKRKSKVAKKKRRLSTKGPAKLDPARFIRLKLIQGITGNKMHAQISKEYPDQAPVLIKTVPSHSRALGEAEVTQDTTLFSTAQAACVLNVIPRRVAGFCLEGRIGQKLGTTSYVIRKEELVAFGMKVRTSGVPGQRARSAERQRLTAATKEVNGNSK